MPKNSNPKSNKPERERPRLLIINDPYPMRICKELAVEIGFDESVVLLQLEYLIGLSTSEPKEGKIWTYQSLTDLQKYFPWWHPATISRILKSLEDVHHVIISGNFNGLRMDRTQWYTLDVEGISKLKSVRIDESILQFAKCIRAKCANAFAQNATCILAKCANAFAQNATTLPKTPTKTSTQIPTETSSSSDARDESEQEEEGQKYFSESFTQKLLSAGVFDNQLDTAEALAVNGGWSEAQLEQLLTKARSDDGRGTPGALFLYRLEHWQPPTETSYAVPGRSGSVSDDEDFAPDERATQVWDLAKRELSPKIPSLEYSTWFANGTIRAWIDGEDFVLVTNNPIHKKSVEKYQEQIETILISILGKTNLVID